jgi:hypothetical protein
VDRLKGIRGKTSKVKNKRNLEKTHTEKKQFRSKNLKRPEPPTKFEKEGIKKRRDRKEKPYTKKRQKKKKKKKMKRGKKCNKKN